MRTNKTKLTRLQDWANSKLGDEDNEMYCLVIDTIVDLMNTRESLNTVVDERPNPLMQSHAHSLTWEERTRIHRTIIDQISGTGL